LALLYKLGRVVVREELVREVCEVAEATTVSKMTTESEMRVRLRLNDAEERWAGIVG